MEREKIYNLLVNDCGVVIEDCPKENGEKTECEYCRLEYIRKKTAGEILRAIGNTPLLDKKRKFGDLTDEEIKVLTPFVNRLLKRIKELAKEYGVDLKKGEKE